MTLSTEAKSTRAAITWPVLLFASVAACGGLLMGYNTAVMAGVLPLVIAEWELSGAEESLLVIAVLVGAVPGALFSGRLADLVGRKDLLMATASLFAVGSFVSGMAHSVEWLIASRALVGMAVGSVSLTAPLYIAEISPASRRGVLVSLFQLGVVLGIVLAYGLAVVLDDLEDGWRLMFQAGAALAMLLGIGMLALPKSPRWLLAIGAEGEARRVLALLGAREPDAQVRAIQELDPPGGSDAWLELLRPEVRSSLLVGIGLFFFQQAVGINTIIFYAPIILSDAGLNTATFSLILTFGIGVVNVLFTIVALLLIDRIGRKRLLSIGFVGMAVSLCTLAYLASDRMRDVPQDEWMIVGALMAFIAFFAVSVGPIAWLYIAEVFPLRIRGLAMSLPAVSHWLFDSLVSGTFHAALLVVGPVGIYFFYASMAVAGWIFCRFAVFETTGKSLEQVELSLRTSARDRPSNLIVYVATCVSGISGVIFGYNLAIVGGALLQVREVFDLSATQQGFVVATVSLGGLLGTLVGGPAADRFGRRSVVMATAVVFVVGAFTVGQAPPPYYQWVVAGILLNGIAMGTASIIVPLYISEIAPIRIRGVLLASIQLTIVIGMCIAYCVAALLSPHPDGWRDMFTLGAAPTVFLGFGMLFLPESPRWLLSQGREGMARRMLRRLESAGIDQQIAEFSSAMENQPAGSWRDLLQPWVRAPLVIGILLYFFRQFSGIGFVFYYSPTVLEMAGFSSALAANLAAAGVAAVNGLMTFASMQLVDRLGRRPLMLGGITVLIASLVALGCLFYFDEHLGRFSGWLILSVMLLFVSAFALSIGTVSGVVVSEIFPQQIRGTASSLVGSSQWVFGMIVSFAFLPMVRAISISGAFFLFAGFGAAALVFCLRYLPETRGHTLEEIELHWRARKHPLKLR